MVLSSGREVVLLQNLKINRVKVSFLPKDGEDVGVGKVLATRSRTKAVSTSQASAARLAVNAEEQRSFDRILAHCATQVHAWFTFPMQLLPASRARSQFFHR